MTANDTGSGTEPTTDSDSRDDGSDAVSTDDQPVEPPSRTESLQATVSSDYKVRGKKDAPGGTGVLGHNTASSGASSGVEGVTDAADSDAAGVRAIGTNQASNAIRALSQNGGSGAHITATSGSINAIFAEQQSTSAVSGTGVYGLANGIDSTGVQGLAANSSGQNVGVRGDTQSTVDGSAGVEGHANGTSGLTYGVAGYNDSTASLSAAVYGEVSATSETSNTNGVFGKDRSPGGIGVHGEAENGTAVFGDATATSGTAWGVYALSDSPEGYAVYSDGRLHAERTVHQTGATNLNRHVATIENTSLTDGADVLGLKCSVSDPSANTNFISFLDLDNQIGQIEGNGSGGVVFTGTSADFAEFFPKADPDDEFDAGEVVGLRDGEVVPLAAVAPADVDATLVVSTGPIVRGNRPPADDRSGHVELALVGQVSVRVSGPVESGDVLIANPAGDGTAVARCTTAEDVEGQPVVGQALAASDGGPDGEARVRTLIGGPGLAAIPGRAALTDRHQSEPHRRIAELTAENEALRAEVATLAAETDHLRERLTALEDHLDLAGSSARRTPADD